MADAQQLPGHLTIGFRRGGEYRRVVEVNIDLTGYALSWEIYSLSDGTIRATGPLDFTTPPHVVALVVDEPTSATLIPGTYGFRGHWVATGNIHRTFLEGVCEVRA